MTMISQYLRAERTDHTEPASFYAPGLESWEDLRGARGRAKFARRTESPVETVHLQESENEELTDTE